MELFSVIQGSLRRLLCGAGYAQHTANYKLKQLIYICQSVPSFPIGCSDVLLVA